MPDLGIDPEFVRGAELHAAGKYWEAHEAWEALWVAAKAPQRRLLLQGLIQVTAAFHKLFAMHDRASAIRILKRGLAKLETVSDTLEGIDVPAFRKRAAACCDALERGAHVDSHDVPRVPFASPAHPPD